MWRKNLKSRKTGILAIIVFTIISFATAIYYKYTAIDNVPYQKTLEEVCGNENLNSYTSNICDNFAANGRRIYNKIDILTLYYLITTNSILYNISFYGIIIIALIIRSILNETKLFKYNLSRISYQKYKKEVIKKMLFSLIIIPIIFINTFIISCVFSGTFDYSEVVSMGTATFAIDFLTMKERFIIIPIISAFLYSIICLEIILISNRLVPNKNISICLSLLLMIIIDLIFELPISTLAYKFGVKSSYFNIIDIVTFNQDFNMILWFGIRILLCIILFIINILLYKNKEKYIYDMERLKVRER